jgi:hypothetical protein
MGIVGMVATATPCRATEHGCGGGNIADVMVLAVMGLAIIALAARYVWNRWERGPYPFILRLMRLGSRR